MAIQDPVSGWKENVYLHKIPNACSTFKLTMGNEWNSVKDGFGMSNNNCPLPKVIQIIFLSFLINQLVLIRYQLIIIYCIFCFQFFIEYFPIIKHILPMLNLYISFIGYVHSTWSGHFNFYKHQFSKNVRLWNI